MSGTGSAFGVSSMDSAFDASGIASALDRKEREWYTSFHADVVERQTPGT